MRDNFVTINVSNFLKSAPKPQVNWYLSQGEPAYYIGSVIEGENIVEKIYPSLRGIIVGEEEKTKEDAINKASEVKSNLLEKDLEPFDEVEAGIDSEATDIQHMFFEHSMRLENIVHIGAMMEGSMTDSMEDVLERFDHEYPVAAMEDLPHVTKHINEDDDLTPEDIIEILRDYGTVGFLVEAYIPEHVPNKTGCTIMYHTGYTNIFYASTFAKACEKAIAWGKEKREEMLSKKAA